MASNINPNNIDGAYPVAGQDNDSQGFRDNFTNIKTNFSYAAAEVSDLQSKAVLIAPLTGTPNAPTPWVNNLGGSVISNGLLSDMAYRTVSLGSTDGSLSLDYEDGNYFTVTPTGNISVAFDNLPATGSPNPYSMLRLAVTVANAAATAYSLTLPSRVGNGSAAVSMQQLIGRDAVNPQKINFAAAGTYVYEFSTVGNDTPIYVQDISRTGWGGSEDLANGGIIDLGVTVSYFETEAAETASLPAGVEGLTKTLLASNVAAGNMTVTVTDAAWGGSSEIEFSANGQACVLQYVDGKWFAVSNNGASFS
jgi:hypothetical protein